MKNQKCNKNVKLCNPHCAEYIFCYKTNMYDKNQDVEYDNLNEQNIVYDI